MTERPVVGDLLVLSADAVAHGGEGICRTADGVVFVRGLLPGEQARVQLTEVKRRFARAELQTVLAQSPYRKALSCAAAIAGAGCCDLAHTDARYGAELKTEILRDHLRRFAGLSGTLVDSVATQRLEPAPSAAAAYSTVPSSQAGMCGWRTVIRRRSDAQGRLGLIAARSQDVVTGVDCAQVVPELAEALHRVAAAKVLEPHVELAMRSGPHGEIAAQWRPLPGRGRRTAAPRHSRARTQARRAAAARQQQWRALPAELGFPESALAGDTQYSWHLPAAAFWQPHYGAIEAYRAHIRAALSGAMAQAKRRGRNEKPLRVWDLYSGVGALSAEPLASRAQDGARFDLDLVETSSPAVEAARRAGTPHPGVHTTVHQLPVIAALRGETRTAGNLGTAPDLVITDPPRAGLGEAVITALARHRPAQLVHIGCDLAAFARDLGGLRRAGFIIHEISCVDAFPGTHHAEAVARLAWGGQIGNRAAGQ